jgi:DNA-binding Lrp family transcriptional regulator
MAGIVNKDLQKIQAMMMIQMKLGQNMSYTEIAKAMNVHPDTVERRFIFAEKAGMFLQLEAQIMSTIVPKAMKAIETALEDGDAETALEVLKSVGVLRDPKAQRSQAQISEDDSLMEAIAGAREVKAIEEGTVDGTIIGRTGLAGLLEEASDETTKEGSVAGNSAEGDGKNTTETSKGDK